MIERLSFANTTFNGSLDFRQVTFGDNGSVFFTSTSLEKALFSGTDVTKCEFNRVAWPRIQKRRSVYDEVFQDTSDDYESLREEYKRIRLSYEGKRDFLAAADFHIGEMRMRMRSERGLSWLTTWLYGILSNYGESHVRAFKVLVVLWLLPTVVYCLFGLRDIQNQQVFRFVPALTLAFLEDHRFLDVLEFSYRNMFFQFSRALEPASLFGRIAQLVQMIFGPIQTALFVLALRRYFQK